MKAIVLGLAHRKGQKKSDGSAFDFAMCYLLRPIENRASERFTQVGYGFEPMEVKCAPEAVAGFAGRKFPSECDLVTDAEPNQFGELTLRIVGVK